MPKLKSYALLVCSLMAVLLLCLAPNYAPVRAAQDPMTGMDMSVGPENVIDGSQHPEKISDDDAYRMFLLAATPQDSSDAELASQRGMFGMLNLTDGQNTQISQIVANFASEFAAVNQARDAVETAAPGTSDAKAYRQQIKDIVHEAQTNLELALGGELSSRLHAVINSEKANMKIATED